MEFSWIVKTENQSKIIERENITAAGYRFMVCSINQGNISVSMTKNTRKKNALSERDQIYIMLLFVLPVQKKTK